MVATDREVYQVEIGLLSDCSPRCRRDAAGGCTRSINGTGRIAASDAGPPLVAARTSRF